MAKRGKRKAGVTTRGHVSGGTHSRADDAALSSQQEAAPVSETSSQGRRGTLDQRRARFALERVKAVITEGCASEYRSYVRRLPSVIIANGLGQAIALELAQAGRKDNVGAGHALVLDHVTAWLVEPEGWGKPSPYHGKSQRSDGNYRNTKLIEAVVAGVDDDLVRAQIEVMAYLKWLKTFAEALIEAKGESTIVAEEVS